MPSRLPGRLVLGRLALAALAGLLGLATLAACTASPPSQRAASIATRFWSGGAGAPGATIDPAQPAAPPAHASAGAYCQILSSTAAAGVDVLHGVGANDPALATTTRAWLADVQAAAPTSLSAQWKLLGQAMLTLVESGSSPGTAKLPSGVAAAQVSAATAAISADAKANCGLDLAGATASAPASTASASASSASSASH
jgi:hypothetical protein